MSRLMSGGSPRSHGLPHVSVDGLSQQITELKSPLDTDHNVPEAEDARDHGIGSGDTTFQEVGRVEGGAYT